MNLVIDIGNTRLKYGVFNKNILFEDGFFSDTNEFNIDQLLNKHTIENSIICSVSNQPENLQKKLEAQTNYIHFTAETPTPIINLYQHKQTLGSDRIAAAIGAFSLYPNQNILAIDTGTCIKYNFINTSGEYLGGAISPGIDMRFKALNSFTHKLPLIQADYNFDTLVGCNTQQSILSGVMNGALKEVEGVIDEYSKQYANLKTVITGGNHVYFAKRVKSSIFADPFLLLKGLNTIIEFNVHK